MSRLFVSLSFISAALILGVICNPGRTQGSYSGCVYPKTKPGSSHNIVLLHRVFIAMSRHPGKATKLRSALQEGITYALCHAA